MVEHKDIQYEKGDICERTDPPADQGCLGRGFLKFEKFYFVEKWYGFLLKILKVRITEYSVTNCLEFTEEYPEVMDEYYSQQAGLFNVSIRNRAIKNFQFNLRTDDCSYAA